MKTLQTKVNLLKALQESPLANTAMYKKQIETIKNITLVLLLIVAVLVAGSLEV